MAFAGRPSGGASGRAPVGKSGSPLLAMELGFRTAPLGGMALT
jgi:hypothetical protein